MIITDEMIAEAAIEVNDAMLRSLPATDDCHHHFSARFERKIRRIIRRVEHPVWTNVLQRAAAIVLLLLIGFSSVLALSPTVRAAVLSWIREQYESFISYYWIDSTSDTVPSIRYSLDGIPEEYTLIESSDDVGCYTEIYTNQSGNLLYFSYSLTPTAAHYYVEAENSYVENIIIFGRSADLYISKDSIHNNSIVWYNEDNSVIFYLSALMDKNELIALAESATPKNSS